MEHGIGNVRRQVVRRRQLIVTSVVDLWPFHGTANLKTAHETRQRRFMSVSFFLFFFSDKGALVGECQIAVISNTIM